MSQSEEDPEIEYLCKKPTLRRHIRPPGVDKVFEPGPNRIFVFGSNLAGIHGAGAARYAYEHFKARWEVGHGLTGEAYALPTKNAWLGTLSLEKIKGYVDEFLDFARAHPEMYFFVTRIGCGLAGYQDYEIAPMFEEAPLNCELPYNWKRKETMVIDSFKDEYRFLSNFWQAEVVLYDQKYASVEHAYQAAKTTDEAYRQRIQNAATSAEAKKLGKSAPLRPDWETVKVDFMRYLVWYKFAHHPELKRKLLETGTAQLIEGNTWGDTFWGVCRGVGENNLGKILMEVRDKLREGK